jgi:hypothetical protein
MGVAASRRDSKTDSNDLSMPNLKKAGCPRGNLAGLFQKKE